ncbi:hypothetical protein PISMIDRAFT_685252 [Pisolithus microcarpus 441]|uniref:Uncharacterized protein n=1 Tax=Pisolithus microcarpus 441 TaxID=765257 RepID=A0A0C9XYF0_9AGAM|nr:hypothetical protein PISMIDRAFT_685252 [Pisolithus microcarpus 441]
MRFDTRVADCSSTIPVLYYEVSSPSFANPQNFPHDFFSACQPRVPNFETDFVVPLTNRGLLKCYSTLPQTLQYRCSERVIIEQTGQCLCNLVCGYDTLQINSKRVNKAGAGSCGSSHATTCAFDR